MALTELMAEGRRRATLDLLAQCPDYALNEGVLKLALDGLGLRAGRDVVRAELAWLEAHGLVRLDRLPDGAGGELLLARLSASGQDVAEGRLHPGVARKRAG